jgi:hypothetical protein
MAHESATALVTYDVTARRIHQWALLAMLAIGFVIGEPGGAVLVAIAAAIQLFGRFWWPADMVRQFVWRVLEPAGILQRVDAPEDRQTRRIARLVAGVVWFVAAALIANGFAVVGWVLVGAVALLMVLDAAVSFCALCFVFGHLEVRGLLPGFLATMPTRAER